METAGKKNDLQLAGDDKRGLLARVKRDIDAGLQQRSHLLELRAKRRRLHKKGRRV